MPSSTLRDRLAGVDRRLERLEDVLPADHDHRVDAVGEQRRDRLAADPVALVLEPVDLDQVRRERRRRRAAPRSARGDLARRRATSTSAIASACSIGASTRVDDRACRPPARRSRRCRRARRPAHGRPRGSNGSATPRAWLGEPVDDVVGDPVALVLAVDDHLAERRALGVVGEQVAQQQRGPAARCGPTPRTAPAAVGSELRGIAMTTLRTRSRRSGATFTACSPAVHQSVTERGRRAGDAPCAMETTSRRACCRSAPWRSGRPSAWRSRRAARSRCRSASSSCSSRWRAARGASSRARSCYESVWGARRCATATARSTSTSTSCA